MLRTPHISPSRIPWRTSLPPAARPAKPATPQLRPDPDAVRFAAQLGLTPDHHQQCLLAGHHPRMLVNCSRQWGKSTITAVKALHTALMRPDSLVLVASRTARQSGLFVRKVAGFVSYLGVRPRRDPGHPLSVLLPNGSRVIGLPGASGDNIRGFSAAALLVIDEAARVSDELYYTARPILAASSGHIWLLSTPRGKTGFFYHEWAHHPHHWERLSVPATECPRIPAEFLEEERTTMGEDWFRQEYLCKFIDLNGTVFSRDLVEQAFTREVAPITEHTPPPNLHDTTFHIGVDLGQKHDFTAIAILERREPAPANFLHPWEESATAYELRHLERLPLGTPYPRIVERIAAITRMQAPANRAELTVDATGVGAPVVDLLKQAGLPCPILSVSITGGHNVHHHAGASTVPKRNLIAGLEVLLEEEQLKIAANLPERRRLVEEFMHLKAGATRQSHQTFGAEGTHHDDLLIAVSLACWSASKPTIGHQTRRLV